MILHCVCFFLFLVIFSAARRGGSEDLWTLKARHRCTCRVAVTAVFFARVSTSTRVAFHCVGSRYYPLKWLLSASEPLQGRRCRAFRDATLPALPATAGYSGFCRLSVVSTQACPFRPLSPDGNEAFSSARLQINGCFFFLFSSPAPLTNWTNHSAALGEGGAMDPKCLRKRIFFPDRLISTGYSKK